MGCPSLLIYSLLLKWIKSVYFVTSLSNSIFKGGNWISVYNYKCIQNVNLHFLLCYQKKEEKNTLCDLYLEAQPLGRVF
jgi:hypothetical protein